MEENNLTKSVWNEFSLVEPSWKSQLEIFERDTGSLTEKK